MKTLSLALVVTIMFTFITACSPSKEYANFEELSNGSVLKCGDITYTFFSGLPNTSLKGEQLGIIDGDEKHKVYHVKGFSADEWVIEYLDVIMSTYSLYKANQVTDIPNELLSLK